LGEENPFIPTSRVRWGFTPQSTYMGLKGEKTNSLMGHFAQEK